MWAYIQLFSLLAAAFFVGVPSGIIIEKLQAEASREPFEVGDFSEEISLLHFRGIENGVLKGSLEGSEARVVVEGAPEVYSLFPGEFEFSVVDILPMLKTIPAPAGSAFVASKNGKYYYPLDATKAAQIAVKNRIFFTDEAAAETAGFVRGQN